MSDEQKVEYALKHIYSIGWENDSGISVYPDTVKTVALGWKARAEKAEADLADANKHREFLVMAIDVVRKERDEARADYDIEKRQHDQTKADNVALRDGLAETLPHATDEFGRMNLLDAKHVAELIVGPDPGAEVRAVVEAASRYIEEPCTDEYDALEKAVGALRGEGRCC